MLDVRSQISDLRNFRSQEFQISERPRKHKVPSPKTKDQRPKDQRPKAQRPRAQSLNELTIRRWPEAQHQQFLGIGALENARMAAFGEFVEKVINLVGHATSSRQTADNLSLVMRDSKFVQ